MLLWFSNTKYYVSAKFEGVLSQLKINWADTQGPSDIMEVLSNQILGMTAQLYD